MASLDFWSKLKHSTLSANTSGLAVQMQRRHLAQTYLMAQRCEFGLSVT
jgi:hypothetical protein